MIRLSRAVHVAAALLLFGSFACAHAQPANGVSAGEFRQHPPTLHALGFEWRIDGDANRNATVAVTYRKRGSAEWKPALPLLRVGDEEAGTREMRFTTPRLFAGSILFLDPDTEYECRFRMQDPDGVKGTAEQQVTARTRAVPARVDAGGARVRHVYPQGYKGTRIEPAYNGLLHAYYGYARFADWNLTTDPVGPGDVILVHAGVYKADRYDYRDYHGLTFHGTYSLTRDGTAEQPIVIRAAGDGEVVFDGAGAYRLFDVSAADHHHIEGLTVRNAEVAVHAGDKGVMGSTGLVVRDCRFEDIGIGIVTENAGSKGFYIADNRFLGRMDRNVLRARVPDPDGKLIQRVNSYFGVKVYGQGHVIEHNYVAYFYDGIDVSTYGTPEPERDLHPVAIDIEGNDIHLVGDNCIEADGGAHNIRVIGNRCFNCAQDAYSFQPLLGGPAYMIRNIGYNFPQRTGVKFWGMRGAGVLVYHNTLTAVPNRHDQAASNVHFRNNVFLGPARSDVPVVGLQTYTSYSSMDYNGYREGVGRPSTYFWHAPRVGMLRDYQLSHEAQRFESWEEFQKATGQEQHGLLLKDAFSLFVNLPEPLVEPLANRAAGSYRVYTPDGLDFRLKPGTPPVDAGVALPNVNDVYTGKAPDLGAYELGAPQPVYGPRQ